MRILNRILFFLILTFTFFLPKSGHADNPGFYGTYSLIYKEGSCAQQKDITIGNDSGRAGEAGYLYIPSDVKFIVYEGILNSNSDPFTNTIAIKGREIIFTQFIKSASDPSHGHTTIFKMKFSANYKNGTINGNSTDDDSLVCQGAIKGTLKRN